MKVFVLTGKDLLRMWSDRRALIVNMVLPLILTFIMGLSFGGGMFGSSTGISAIPLVMVSADLPDQLKERLADGLRETGFFTVTWADSLTADTLVRGGENAAAVVFPPEFLRRNLEYKDTSVEIWKDPGSPFKAGIVEQIISRTVARYQGSEAAYVALWPEDVESPDAETQQQLNNFFEGDFATVWKRWRSADDDDNLKGFRDEFTQTIDHHVAFSDAMQKSLITLNVTDQAALAAVTETKDFNLFNYFLPSFSVFFLMFGISASCRDFHRERDNGTFQRQMLSPVRGLDYILGKWLSAVVQGSMQLVVLFLAGFVLFKINLGPDAWSLATVVVLCCSAGSGVFLLVALLSKSEKMMDSLSTVIILVSAMIGGNMMPIDQMPEWIKSAAQAFFNFWANTGFNNVISENISVAEAPQPVLVLTGISVVFLALNLIVFSLRRRSGGLA